MYNNFAAEIPRERWAQSYDDQGRRYGHMTTNLVKCINSVLKGTRHLLVISIVQETHFRLGKVWADKSAQVEAMLNEGRNWAPDLEKTMNKIQHQATSMHVHNFFILYPCAYAVVACVYLNVDTHIYVDDCYSLHNMCNIYSCEFKYLPNDAYWPPTVSEEWFSNPQLRKKLRGRPKSNRIHTDTDDPQREQGLPKLCGHCKGEGHNRKIVHISQDIEQADKSFGGTLRNVPVGGGTRKASKRSRSSSGPSPSVATSSSSSVTHEAKSVHMAVNNAVLEAGAKPEVGLADVNLNETVDLTVNGGFISFLNSQGEGYLTLGVYGLGAGSGFDGVWGYTGNGYLGFIVAEMAMKQAMLSVEPPDVIHGKQQAVLKAAEG
ncbi:hypothetical protein F3Y22_tig00111210pilonHSYRG00342 [Hibiscus syriacus]|uniref:Uncharacterized protein n=1 Tax=Hibiscus syriacus TaxID=106335 RepID=A0A6A2YV81_HIBSY|nr:hypothetical protein F3Y22_tig00111210pilonHSYRG00342 [Hibiscus syriacus]